MHIQPCTHLFHHIHELSSRPLVVAGFGVPYPFPLEKRLTTTSLPEVSSTLCYRESTRSPIQILAVLTCNEGFPFSWSHGRTVGQTFALVVVSDPPDCVVLFWYGVAVGFSTQFSQQVHERGVTTPLELAKCTSSHRLIGKAYNRDLCRSGHPHIGRTPKRILDDGESAPRNAL